MSPPLSLTSSTHAYAFATYGQQAALGLLVLLGAAQIRSLSGILFLPLVGVIMLAAGAVGLYAITASRRSPANPEPALRLELVAAAGMALVNLFFSAALLVVFGLDRGLTTHVYVLAVGAGGIVRCWQIRRDRKRLHLAMADARPSDPTLAEPKKTDQ